MCSTSPMKPSLLDKLEQMQRRADELDALLAAPDCTADLQRYRNMTRELAELQPVVGLYVQYKAKTEDLSQAESLLSDPDMKELAQQEMQDARAALDALEAQLQVALLPRDPDDSRNVFVEIRAGTGGEESALFAADLLRMYARYAERKRWATEVISESPSDLGGYKEVILRVAGEGAYGLLKYESGGHRVQRVPKTETQGRIHTSAATVAVMPEMDEAQAIQINPSDLRIDTFRASGAGGQHINKTDSAIRITHLPTGLVVECQDERSQHRNKARALSVLAARLAERERQARQAEEAATRKSLVGSGDRSDRIRTYNFPQGRVSEHRINITLYKIDAIVDGDLDELLTALRTEDQAAQLAALGAN